MQSPFTLRRQRAGVHPVQFVHQNLAERGSGFDSPGLGSQLPAVTGAMEPSNPTSKNADWGYSRGPFMTAIRIGFSLFPPKIG